VRVVAGDSVGSGGEGLGDGDSGRVNGGDIGGDDAYQSTQVNIDLSGMVSSNGDGIGLNDLDGPIELNSGEMGNRRDVLVLKNTQSENKKNDKNDKNDIKNEKNLKISEHDQIASFRQAQQDGILSLHHDINGGNLIHTDELQLGLGLQFTYSEPKKEREKITKNNEKNDNKIEQHNSHFLLQQHSQTQPQTPQSRDIDNIDQISEYSQNSLDFVDKNDNNFQYEISSQQNFDKNPPAPDSFTTTSIHPTDLTIGSSYTVDVTTQTYLLTWDTALALADGDIDVEFSGEIKSAFLDEKSGEKKDEKNVDDNDRVGQCSGVSNDDMGIDIYGGKGFLGEGQDGGNFEQNVGDLIEKNVGNFCESKNGDNSSIIDGSNDGSNDGLNRDIITIIETDPQNDKIDPKIDSSINPHPLSRFNSDQKLPTLEDELIDQFNINLDLPEYVKSTVSCFSLDNMSNLKQFMQPRSILVFDIDDTLISPAFKTQFASNDGVDMLNEFLFKANSGNHFDHFNNFFQNLTTKFRNLKRISNPSENSLPQLLSKIWSEFPSIKQLVVTARSDNLIQLTHDTFSKLGFEFDGKKPTLLEDGHFVALFDDRINYTVSKGIVFTNGHHKGFVLFDLLQRGVFHREKKLCTVKKCDFIGMGKRCEQLVRVAEIRNNDNDGNNDGNNNNNNFSHFSNFLNQEDEFDNSNPLTTGLTHWMQLDNSSDIRIIDIFDKIDSKKSPQNPQNNPPKNPRPSPHTQTYITYEEIIDIKSPLEQLWVIDDQLGVVQQVVEVFTASPGFEFLPNFALKIPLFSKFQIPIVICCQYIASTRETADKKTKSDERINNLNQLLLTTMDNVHVDQFKGQFGQFGQNDKNLSKNGEKNHKNNSPKNSPLELNTTHIIPLSPSQTLNNNNDTHITLTRGHLIEVQLHFFALHVLRDYFAQKNIDKNKNIEQNEDFCLTNRSTETHSFHDYVNIFNLDKYPALFDIYVQSQDGYNEYSKQFFHHQKKNREKSIKNDKNDKNDKNEQNSIETESILSDELAHEVLANYHLNMNRNKITDPIDVGLFDGNGLVDLRFWFEKNGFFNLFDEKNNNSQNNKNSNNNNNHYYATHSTYSASYGHSNQNRHYKHSSRVGNKDDTSIGRKYEGNNNNYNQHHSQNNHKNNNFSRNHRSSIDNSTQHSHYPRTQAATMRCNSNVHYSNQNHAFNGHNHSKDDNTTQNDQKKSNK
jgi:hypothetical protein